MYWDAVSFKGLEPQGELIKEETHQGVRYFFFKGLNEDGKEQIFYETENGFRIKKELEEKRKKKKSRS